MINRVYIFVGYISLRFRLIATWLIFVRWWVAKRLMLWVEEGSTARKIDLKLLVIEASFLNELVLSWD